MATDDRLKDVLDALEELKSDSTVPKNIKSKIELIIDSLQEAQELSIKVNRALNELDEISDNCNIQPYTRTQIWNVVSLLESVSS
jgi:uncharacterized protein (UPF0147 family)